MAVIWLLILALAGCAAPPALGVPKYLPPETAGLRYKAVLIAGDGSIEAFDNATEEMARRLLAAGTEPSDVRRFSARRDVVDAGRANYARLRSVLAEIAQMRPAPGQGCFVFATSHGGYDRGLVLTQDEFLDPVNLDRALSAGCGNAPTVAIISGCFSGSFVRPPMNRPNRIILTAARPDRTSFGCQAGRQFTVYDTCLFKAMGRTADWNGIYAAVQRCVSRNEQEDGETPSEPQAYFGSAAAAAPALTPR
jgi:hypothetical protein